MVNGLTALFRDGTLLGMTDRQILERFVERQDEAAFDVILSRHGPMVRNVCRQLLYNPHDVDDAFQAVFLVLIRKARFLRADESLGPWLYKVAGRVAARARANRLKRSARESSHAELSEPAYCAPSVDFEIPSVIHDELGRLPERLRAPLVLCYLEGLTHDLAARQLCCPVGTVRSRLARGRSVLHRRITRRGFALSAAALGGMLESSAIAAVASQIPAPPIRAVTQATIESAGRAGMGYSTRFATFLEGAWNVAQFKGIAIFGAVVSIGALAIGLSQTASVGRTPAPTPQASASPIGAKPVKTDSPRAAIAADAPATPLQQGPAKDPIEPYLLTKEAGPYMVRAKVFRGPDAQRLAIALAEELSTDYGLRAYIFRKKDFPDSRMIRGTPPQAPREVLAPDIKSREKIRTIDEVAVLVGDEKDMASQEKLWREVKNIQPKCLEQISSPFPWRRGLATALRTTNPFGRAEILSPRAEQKPMMEGSGADG
jgi:RNA polymerase sigma factor (sigma-70 family)